MLKKYICAFFAFLICLFFFNNNILSAEVRNNMSKKQTAGRDLLGDIAPKFAELNDDVLFGEVWSREDKLSARDRSMITISALFSAGLYPQLKAHLEIGKKHGITREEAVEIVTQLAFYCGWPKAWSTFPLIREVYGNDKSESANVSTDKFFELAKKRYSVRKFSDKPIEKEKLNRVLEVGNLAPTAKNQQPHRIYVIQSEKSLAKLKELTHCGYGAKTVLLFTYNTDETWKNPLEEGINSGVEDVSIVATHIMFEATELGLSTCWCNYFPNSKLEETFNIPKNEKSVLIMPIGYADENSNPSPLHTKKKELYQIVKYL